MKAYLVLLTAIVNLNHFFIENVVISNANTVATLVIQRANALARKIAVLIRNVRMVALEKLVHLTQTVLQENLVALIRNVRFFALEKLVHLTQTVIQEGVVIPITLAHILIAKVILVLLVGLSPSS